MAVLTIGGVLLLGLVAIALKAVGFVLGVALLPLRIVLGGFCALGGIVALVLLVPFIAIAGVALLVGLTLGGLLLLAHVVF